MRPLTDSELCAAIVCALSDGSSLGAKPHTSSLRVYASSFTGTALVSYLLRTGLGSSRAEALQVANDWMQRGFLQAVDRGVTVRDNSALFV